MKKSIFLLLVLFSLTGCQTAPAAEPITTIYLIRHAEKDRSEGVGENPELTETGHARAQGWARVFREEPLDAVYSTHYKRTEQTATPTAQFYRLEVMSYEPYDIDPVEFIEKHKGQNVLIVGHSNTTPMLVNRFIGQERYEQLADTVNGNLYIVTHQGATIQAKVLSIENY